MIDPELAAGNALQRVRTGVAEARLLVVGDLMLDQFLYGSVERISPEAPVPVVEVEREVSRLGGAANVVNNLRSLGAPVDLAGLLGSDAAGASVRAMLAERGVGCGAVLSAGDRPTAVKTRVIAQHQQVVRFDRESRTPLPEALRAELLAAVTGRLPGSRGVVVSDYGKGVVDRTFMDTLVAAAAALDCPVFVDPKPPNQDCYRGVDTITPNTRETEQMAGCAARSDTEAAAAGRRLLERLSCRCVLVTRGDRGMTLVERDREPLHIPVRARDVFDVTGAGDTTISVLALARGCGASAAEAACLANLAAGMVVGKLGTAVTTLDELAGATAPGAAPVRTHHPA